MLGQLNELMKKWIYEVSVRKVIHPPPKVCIRVVGGEVGVCVCVSEVL